MLRSVLSLMKMASFNALDQLLHFADILYLLCMVAVQVNNTKSVEEKYSLNSTFTCNKFWNWDLDQGWIVKNILIFVKPTDQVLQAVRQAPL